MHAKPEAPVAATLAIDLAKDVFELGFADARGTLIQRQRRPVFAPRLDNHAPCCHKSRRSSMTPCTRCFTSRTSSAGLVQQTGRIVAALDPT